MEYRIVYDDELYHHGIKGQRWGKRNGPPYPLGSDDYSVREKKEQYLAAKKASKTAKKAYNRAVNKAYYGSSSEALKDAKNKEVASMKADKAVEIAKKQYKDSKKERSTKEVARILGISDKEAEQVKKYAKIIGISLATTAGLVAAGYLISRNKQAFSKISKDLVEKGKIAVSFDGVNVKYASQRVFNVNKSGAHKVYDIGSKSLFNKRLVGSTALNHGYDRIGASFLNDAISNPKVHPNLVELVKNVRVNQVDYGASRRLSCWSTSQSYFMSALTGRDFASMNFQNLVDFNSFKSLYKTQPKIFNVLGQESKDFVGNFGREGVKFSEDYGKKLIENVFANIGKANNLTADGKRTIGFMEAGYRGMTCTHQWNFEIIHQSDGSKILEIIDGYAGTRQRVGYKSAKGAIEFIKSGVSDVDGNFNDFMRELYHYNADSLRFYAPNPKTINTNVLSTVILGKWR